MLSVTLILLKLPEKGFLLAGDIAPHFHYLGFLDGGYGSCRGCSKSNQDCWGCKDFEGLTRRLNVADGHIVKVKGARKTIFGTLWYQMNHMTIIREKSSHSYRYLEWHLQLQEIEAAKRRPHKTGCLPHMRSRFSSLRIRWRRFS